jgi:periodic tryptophan protein 1
MVWDTSTNPGVRRAFADKVRQLDGEVEERLVGVEDDSSDDSEDEGEAETGDGKNDGDGWESMDED